MSLIKEGSEDRDRRSTRDTMGEVPPDRAFLGPKTSRPLRAGHASEDAPEGFQGGGLNQT